MKKILCLVLVLALALCAAAFAEEQVMSFADYTAAAVDDDVCVETYVQATQSWWDEKITVYGQNEDGAVFIYNMACTQEDAEKLVPGTKIKVTGVKGEWAGEVEILDATFEFVDGDPFIAEPEDLTAVFGTDDLVNHMNELFAIKGAKVVASRMEGNDDDLAFLYGWNGSGSRDDNGGVGADLYFNVDINGAVYTLTVESYLCGNSTDVYQAVEALQVGDVIDLEGFLYWYEGANPHITAVTPAV